MDMMIAAHAKTVGAVFVTRDKAFRFLKPEVVLEDWGR